MKPGFYVAVEVDRKGRVSSIVYRGGYPGEWWSRVRQDVDAAHLMHARCFFVAVGRGKQQIQECESIGDPMSVPPDA